MMKALRTVLLMLAIGCLCVVLSEARRRNSRISGPRRPHTRTADGSHAHSKLSTGPRRKPHTKLHTHPATHTHHVRETGSNAGSELTFTLQTNDESTDCVNDTVRIDVSYRIATNDTWIPLQNITRNRRESQCASSTCRIPLPEVVSDEGAEFRFIQWDHEGGECGCWLLEVLSILTPNAVSFIVSVGNDVRIVACANVGASIDTLCESGSQADQLQGLMFCGGSASVPRGMVTRRFDPGPNGGFVGFCTRPQNGESDVDLLVGDIGVAPVCDSPPGPDTSFIEISFDLRFPSTAFNCCDIIDNFDEGVELAVRRPTDDFWIPLGFFTRNDNRADSNNTIHIPGGNSPLQLRGYNVTPRVQGDNSLRSEKVVVCDFEFFQDGMQFRWLQTARHTSNGTRDSWYIDNVNITMHTANCFKVLLYDNFGTSGTNRSTFPFVKDGEVLSAEVSGGDRNETSVLVFGRDEVVDASVESRIAVTRPLELLCDPVAVDPQPTATTTMDATTSTAETSTPVTSMPPTSSGLPSPSPTLSTFTLSSLPPPSSSTGSPSPTPSSSTPVLTPSPTPDPVLTPSPTPDPVLTPSPTPAPALNENDREILAFIENDPVLGPILQLSEENPDQAAGELEAATEGEVNETAAVFLLDTILKRTEGRVVSQEFSQDVVDTANNILRSTMEDEEPQLLAGSTMLRTLDLFALMQHNASLGEPVSSDNVVLQTQEEVGPDGDEDVTGIEQEGHMIRLPQELLAFVNQSVRVSSFFYQNMSGLLSSTLAGQESNMRMASSVVSSSLLCGEEQCETLEAGLNQPVVITIPHSTQLVEEMRRGGNVTCVFWNFDNQEGVLISGQWDVRGCERNAELSNETHTICECDHLTHFGILLSPNPSGFSSAEVFALEIIGIVAVTISLVALVITVFSFLFLRSLWSMRNYIHVNLCVSLFVAQLTFVIGAEPRDSTVGCQVVAVLLHYFFLVTFMWMLMEGVVLYVALVRVFIKHTKRYIIGFTLASYGIPLLYMALVVPLGFALPNGPHYGSDQACWLRYDTFFIWAFIGPVILIILANVGFFIMAIAIMYRHQRRQTHKDKISTVKHWLKASISLLVVMGITWIIGVLAFDALRFIAYLSALFIALQGLAIFILFVVLSKQVRDSYRKWWKVKVSESDFLSRHFGDKSFPSTAVTAVRTTSPTIDRSKSIDVSVADRDAIQIVVEGEEEREVEREEEREVEREEEEVDPSVFNITFIPSSLTAWFRKVSSRRRTDSGASAKSVKLRRSVKSATLPIPDKHSSSSSSFRDKLGLSWKRKRPAAENDYVDSAELGKDQDKKEETDL